jgi:tRNA dimethylallyltransferase
VAVVGPTATGKSELAVALAVALGGEVVNADAAQLYRGMDIGTAKLPAERRRGVPHHLLDVLEVTETASVAAYQRDARSVIEGVLRRGRVPILVGGSGLYVSAVLDELSFPGTDPRVRAELERELASAGSHALHERLARLDPAAAAAVLPANGRRVVRALEVIEITGRPFGARLPAPAAARWGAVLLGLRRDLPGLDAAIAARVEGMLADGLLAEVAELAGRGLREGRTAGRALGYRQLLAVLDGHAEQAAAVAETVRATRRFARRQRSWFGRDPRISWLDATRPDLVDAALRVAGAAREPAGSPTGEGEGGRS